MVNDTRVWLYNSKADGYKGEEYTKYLLLGDSWKDNLDDTLDTAEITLAGLDTQQEFAPTTKFIIEKGYWDGDSWVLLEQWHWQVDNDAVTKPILADDGYYNHAISLIEPLVVAQQRLCDNFAVTYKLQDVTLNIAPTYDVTSKASITKNEIAPSANSFIFGCSYETKDTGTRLIDTRRTRVGHKFEWVMPTWYQVQLYKETKDSDGTITRTLETRTPSWNDWQDFKRNQEIPKGETSKEIRLPAPMLKVSQGKEGTTDEFSQLGFCAIEVNVTRTNGTTTESVAVEGGDSNNTLTVLPNGSSTDEKWTKDKWSIYSGKYDVVKEQEIASGWVCSDFQLDSNIVGKIGLSKVAEFTTNYTNRTIIFTAEAGWQYSVAINLKSFGVVSYPSTTAVGIDEIRAYPYTESYAERIRTSLLSGGQLWQKQNRLGDQTSETLPLYQGIFMAVAQGDTQTKVFVSPPPVSVYELLNKAMATTQAFTKTDGIAVQDLLLETTDKGATPPTPFYLSAESVAKTKYVQAVENFYNQQNFYQVLCEGGKYLHARPKLRFGTNDRYEITWKKYGQTEQHKDGNNTMSVFNSRFVSEYVSAISSYVANMVQLGGTRTEYLKAVTSDDTYTVSNDNACLKTQSPIIELVDMQFKKIGDTTWYSMFGKGTLGTSSCGYVFEENVYNTLGVTATESVNKGVAIYYRLGDNEIKGFQYQLPTVNTGDAYNDYSIKKIIYLASGGAGTAWSEIKVNDYIFKVTYRTKDTLRIEQSRPDLRKYLLNSKYDIVPQHYQFSNQQDTMIDSDAYGNNIYGQLIRTGNTTYEVQEWVDDYSKVKKAGDLYNIFGNLYYVSKVSTTQYSDHLVSTVEYSKDFNRLSAIIGIPSEPRFYEISEQSNITREKVITQNIIVTDNAIDIDMTPETTSITRLGWQRLNNILFFNGKYPQWAKTEWANDPDGQNLYPHDTKTLHGITTYTSKSALVMEWDMVDNYSAGDQSVYTAFGDKTDSDQSDKAYRLLEPYRYCDEYGRADLLSFNISGDFSTALTDSEVQALPQLPTTHDIGTTTESMFANPTPYVLLKDNREAISCNYILQALTGSDNIVLSSMFWTQQKRNLTSSTQYSTFLAFSLQEVDKLTDDSIPDNQLKRGADGNVILFPITTTVASIYTVNGTTIGIKLDVEQAFTENGYTAETMANFLSDVKAVCVVLNGLSQNSTPTTPLRPFVLAKNLNGTRDTGTIYIANLRDGYFTKQ